jgi:hypothetical protein
MRAPRPTVPGTAVVVAATGVLGLAFLALALLPRGAAIALGAVAVVAGLGFAAWCRGEDSRGADVGRIASWRIVR